MLYNSIEIIGRCADEIIVMGHNSFKCDYPRILKQLLED